MRTLTWIVIIITLLCGGLIAYSLYAAELQVLQIDVQTVPAGAIPEVFDLLKEELAADAPMGRAYRQGPLAEGGDYVFHVYTLRLGNLGVLAADWVDLVLDPAPGSILQPTDDQPKNLPPMTQGDFRQVMLAEMGSQPGDKLTLTYFVFGRPYSIVVAVPGR